MEKKSFKSFRIRHRGPDWSGVHVDENHVMNHERLAIVGVDSGAQPFVSNDGLAVLSVNGEIYNYQTLMKKLNLPSDYKVKSDCEVILLLYGVYGSEFLNTLDGVFSFYIYDKRSNSVLIARDSVGVTTLYVGFNSSNKTLWVASEMKCMSEDCDTIVSFPPGSYVQINVSKSSLESFDLNKCLFKRFYNPVWFDDSQIPSILDFPEPNYALLKDSLVSAVHKRLMSEVPFGVLLSGGLDSSLVASIAARAIRDFSRRHPGEDFDLHNKANGGPYDSSLDSLKSLEWWPKLHTFSIGLSDSTDLKMARVVADFLKTVHHEWVFSLQEGFDAISDVIYHLETFDVTTVRASVPMYLLSRKIKACGIKMVLSGEGADEIFGGYLYFHNAPSAVQFHKDTVKLIKGLHTSDNLRANKSTMAWGLEARIPFLDLEFLRVSMETIPPEFKMTSKSKIEKYVLRKAFDTRDDPFLPDSILWRQKEQFSDGVGYSWIDQLKTFTQSTISDDEFSSASVRFPVKTPKTKEAYYYRTIFDGHFPHASCLESVNLWIPRADWGCPEDPSGRAQTSHVNSYTVKK